VPCKNATAINSILDPKRFSFAFINKYFDFQEYKDPIKSYIDDQLFFELESNRVKRTNFYIMRSEVQMQDEYFQLGQMNENEFVQV
jgi:hypothetical protein